MSEKIWYKDDFDWTPEQPKLSRKEKYKENKQKIEKRRLNETSECLSDTKEALFSNLDYISKNKLCMTPEFSHEHPKLWRRLNVQKALLNKSAELWTTKQQDIMLFLAWKNQKIKKEFGHYPFEVEKWKS